MTLTRMFSYPRAPHALVLELDTPDAECAVLELVRRFSRWHRVESRVVYGGRTELVLLLRPVKKHTGFERALNRSMGVSGATLYPPGAPIAS